MTEVSKSLQQPNGATYTEGAVFVADTGNRRIVYKALRPSVFLEPKKLKVDELKEALQERQVTVDQGTRKPDLIKALDKWIQNERKKSKCSNSDVSELPLDKELKKPLALVAVGSDLLMVSDVAARGVYQVAITNNGACLKGSVTLVMKLPETSEPFGLACDDSQLYVDDSSREGEITKLNLATLENDKLARNGSEDCHTVHGGAIKMITPTNSLCEFLG